MLQGFKDWASRFHPQLPLTQRESNRLLTALTTSFRSHLDEVHPRTAEEDGRQRQNENVSAPKPGRTEVHSSAAFADRHLASVLTDLTGPKRKVVMPADQDLVNARGELKKDSAQDPISLLEHYEIRGAATIPIARLCLEHFQSSLAGKPEEARDQAIGKGQAGKRTLLWMWNGGQSRFAAFAEDLTCLEVLVSLVIKEGNEEYLWQWLQLDYATNDTETSLKHSRNKASNRYSWKGRVLRMMVKDKLFPSQREHTSADSALDIIFKAHNMRTTAPKGHHLRQIPLAPAAITISSALVGEAPQYTVADVGHYERYMNLIAKITGDEIRAQLHLHHPTNANAAPAFEFYRRCMTETDLLWARVGVHLRSPIRDGSRLSDGGIKREVMPLLLIIGQFEAMGHSEEAQWLKDRLWELVPEETRKRLDAEVRKCKVLYESRRQKLVRQPAEEASPSADAAPFSTFAWTG